MRRLNRAACALACASLVLSACGGGGGGGSGDETAPAPAQVRSLASMTPPAGFDFASVRTTRGLLSTELPSKAGGFTDPAQSYVSIWYLDSQADRQQLAFLTLESARAMDAQGGIKLQVPAGIGTLSFELYDKNSSLTGELRL